MRSSPPRDFGLYEARREHDACGVGAVVNISGRRDRALVELGRQILLNLEHRGAASSDEATGDGAGVLLHIPHEFFAAECDRIGFSLPSAGAYGVAMLFSPHHEELRADCHAQLEEALAHYGLSPLGWRPVPVDNRTLGELAKAAEPVCSQLFIGGAGLENEAFERRLFMARK